MKKIIPILLLAFIIPQVALASWWNPFSWSIFHKKDTKTKVIENPTDSPRGYTLEELQKMGGQPVNSDQSQNIKPAVVTKSTEPNISDVVADMYADSSITIQDLEIILLISSEANRYIQGIPRNVSAMKELAASLNFNNSSLVEINSALDQWGEFYINGFVKIKNSADKQYTELQSQQKFMFNLSKELRKKYIPKSKGDSYLQEIKGYWDETSKQRKDTYNALDKLSSEYLAAKKEIADEIYKHLSEAQNNLSKFSLPNPTYSYPMVNFPIYTPPTRTYCTSFGDSLSCTSYHN